MVQFCYSIWSTSFVTEKAFLPHLTKTSLRNFSDKHVCILASLSKHGALAQWFKLPAWKVGDCRFEPRSSVQVSKKQNVSSLLTRKDYPLTRSSELGLRSPVLEFWICVWTHSSHHTQEVLLAQFSLYVHKGYKISTARFHQLNLIYNNPVYTVWRCVYILLYVKIMEMSRQKEARSRDYALLLFGMTSKVLSVQR